MKRHFCIAIAACTAAFASFASDITVDPNPFTSTASRTQVLDELGGFRRADVNPWADDYDQLRHYAGRLTRAQVKDEFMQARNEVAELSREDSGSMYLARSKAVWRRLPNEVAHAE